MIARGKKLRFYFVMTVGILCRGHRLSFAYVNRIDNSALGIDYLIGTALGTNVSAIQLHNITFCK